jgi:drug/metabolite transporter (DMT)-like permease
MNLENLKTPATLGAIAGVLSKFSAKTDVVFGKILLDTATPFVVAFAEIAAAAVLLFFYIGAKSFVQNMKEIEHRELGYITISAILSSVLGPVFFLQGLKNTSAINTSLLVNLNPLFLSLVAVFLMHEIFTKRLIAGVSLMTFGVLFLATKGFTQALNFNNGDFLIIISAVSFSLGTTVFKRYVHYRNITFLVAYRAIIGSILLGGFLFIWHRNDLTTLVNFKPALHLLLIYAIVGVIFTYILHYYSLENTTMTNHAIFTLMSPIIGVAYANAFLDEKIEMIHIVSMIIIIIGLLVTKFDMLQKTLILTRMRFKHLHNN